MSTAACPCYQERRIIMATALTPWTAGFGTLEPFRKEMETLMEQFFGDEPATGKTFAMKSWAPRVDVEETEKEILVKADLPGVDPKNVEVSVERGVLTVRGEKKEEKEEKKKNHHRVERFAGSFFRAIALPPGADAEKVAATSANGVVTITIPKKPEAQAKKIAVTPRG
jgi:HSP20 family protein